MREHQIVITLKPEQFLEIQKRARAANAKSMGIFVRQQLLAALGIEGTLDATQAPSGDADVDAALTQIRRLHGELKTFVAESLSLYNMEMQGVQQETEQAAADTPAARVNDPLEDVARRTFAISPRLGAIGESQQAEPEKVQRQRSANDVAATNVPSGPVGSEHHRHEPHRREQHRYYHPHAASDLMDVPFKTAGTARGGTPVAASNSEAPEIKDPLEKLLGGEDATVAQTTMPAAPIPQPVIRPVVPAVPTVQSASVYYEQPVPVVNPAVVEQPASEAPALYADADLDESFLNESYEAAMSEPDLSPAVTPQPAQDTPNQPPPRRSLDYPSLSGSPPPKRRQV